MVQRKKTINLDKNNTKTAYTIGTRITRAHFANRIGFYDRKTNIMFYEQDLTYDTWIWLVNKVKDKLKLTPQNAAKYVNYIYQSKLKVKDNKLSNLNEFIIALRDTCGKWFTIVPKMKSV